MISSIEAQKRIDQADAELARLDRDDEHASAAMAEALQSGGDTSRIEAGIAKRAAERLGLVARRRAAAQVLTLAVAEEDATARTAEIARLRKQRADRVRILEAGAARIRNARVELELSLGPHHQAMVDDARDCGALRRLGETMDVDPRGTRINDLLVSPLRPGCMPFEIGIVNSVASPDDEAVALADEARRAAASAAARAMAGAAAPRPLPVPRRAPPPQPMVSLDDELDGIDAA